MKGKRLLEEIEERGWNIWNGNIERDEERKLTYISPKVSLVIDYVIGNMETRDKVDRLIIEERTESDHLPLCVYI